MVSSANKIGTENLISIEDDEMMDRMIAEEYDLWKKEHGMSNEDNSGPEDNSTAQETDEVQEVTVVKRAYEYTDDAIYLTVRTARNKALFAYLEDGKIKYTESIQKDGETIYPQDLPFNRGIYYPIVGVPLKEMMEQTEQLEILPICSMIKEHLYKYIDMQSDDIEIFSYFILFTWFYRKVNTVPYLRFIGDTGKGKSRILRAITDICFYPVSAAGSSSASGIIRFNELWHGTLRMDEADLSGGAENDLVKAINLGFEKGQSFIKTNPSDVTKSDYFDPFCPKVFAMRKTFPDNATEGRVISFTPRETSRRDIPVNLPPVYDREVEEIRAILAKFAIYSWKYVDAYNIYDYGDLPIEARLKQMATPLSLIFQLMPEGEKRFRDYILQRQSELRETRSQSKEGEAFNQLYSLAVGEDNVPEEFEQFRMEDGSLSAVSPTMLAMLLGENATRTLSSIGVMVENNSVPINTGGKKKTRRYVFKNGHAWKEAFQRYYFSDSEDENMDGVPDCPEVLKSKRYTDTSIAS
ncbi:hypothetical protein [Methanolobus sp. WCC5]|uniref:hypothetical protein n=1 Tax=Methanolobus sp. WCC5 TaxID=3125785 RepID=UPI003252B64D